MKGFSSNADLEVFDNFAPVRKTFAQIVDEAALNYPNREAFIIGKDRITFLQFQERANQIAKGLMSIGVRKGDHTAILMHNIVEYPLAAMGIIKAGGLIVPCNTRYKKDELEYVLKKAKISTLVMVDEFPEANISYWNLVNQLIPELSSSDPGKLKSEKFPDLKRVVIFKSGNFKGCYSVDDLEKLKARISDNDLETRQAEIDPDDNGLMIFTSGTTGFPKGVLLRHTGLVTSSETMKRAWNINENDKMLSYIPYFTVYGTVTGLVGPFVFGIPVIIGNVFNPKEFLEYIEKERASILCTVPAMMELLYAHPDFPKTDFSSLKAGNIGGALCPPEMMRRARSNKKGWGMDCPEMSTVYGLTETHSGITTCVLGDPEEKAVHTVGRVYPLNELRIVDPVTGEDKEQGQEGEVIVRGNAIMSGYYDDPEQTAEKIRDGWLYTGDLGVLDKDGYLTITGRATDMIITGAFNVYPKEIENKILEHPKVMSVSAFAVPDKKYGEVPMVAVILKPGENMSTDDLISFCKEKMGSYKVPRYVEFVNEFPINPGGKVQKFKQKEWAIAKLGLSDI